MRRLPMQHLGFANECLAELDTWIEWREFPSNGVVRRLLSHGGGRNRWTEHRLKPLKAACTGIAISSKSLNPSRRLSGEMSTEALTTCAMKAN